MGLVLAFPLSLLGWGGGSSGPPLAPGMSACVPENSENSSIPPILTPLGHPHPRAPDSLGLSQGNRVGDGGNRGELPRAPSHQPGSASHTSSLSPHAQMWMSVPGTRCCAGEAPVPTQMGVMSASVPLDMRWQLRALPAKVSVACKRERIQVCAFVHLPEYILVYLCA